MIIPGRCKKCIQAPDVRWNKPFKTRMTELHDQWLSEGVHQFAGGGNMKYEGSFQEKNDCMGT